MKKTLSALLFLGFATFGAHAQSTATTVSYNKATQPALMLLLPYAPEVAEGALLQNLKKMGYTPEPSSPLFGKKNTINGYYVFKNVSLKESSEKLVDLYFKVEPKGKKESNQSLVYLLMARGNQFISAENDKSGYAAGQSLLNKFPEHSAAYQLTLDVAAQEETVKAAEKKFGKLQSDEVELNKQLTELQEQLKNNKLQQENQLKVINAEKATLEALRRKKG